MSEVGKLEGGEALNEDDLIQLGLLEGLRNYRVVYEAKNYIVNASRNGDRFSLKYAEMFGEERTMAVDCDMKTGQLSNLVNCTASDVSAFVNGVSV